MIHNQLCETNLQGVLQRLTVNWSTRRHCTVCLHPINRDKNLAVWATPKTVEQMFIKPVPLTKPLLVISQLENTMKQRNRMSWNNASFSLAAGTDLTAGAQLFKTFNRAWLEPNIRDLSTTVFLIITTWLSTLETLNKLIFLYSFYLEAFDIPLRQNIQ